MKKLLVFLFLTNILFAENTSNEIFLKKINETFISSSIPIVISSHNISTGEVHTTFPKRENYSLWLDVRTLDNVKDNSSQKILKGKMDELVVFYLKSDDLFSTDNNLISDKFFQRLYGYLSYLEKHSEQKENKKMLLALLDKILKDSMLLMKNSNNFLNYMMSISMMKNLYASLSNLKNYKDIFLKYPLVKSELFFEKLEQNKQNTLKFWKEAEQRSFEEASLSKETMQKIKDEVTLKFEPILDNIYKKAKVVILDGSEKNIKAYDEYLIHVQEIDNPRWERFKYISSIYKVKTFEILGIENNNFGNIPNMMVKILPRMLLLPLHPYQEVYTEHQALEEMQRELFGSKL